MFKKRIALFLIPMMLVAGIAFGYTRDWDNADPIDHTLNSKWPAEIREVMTDVEERLDDIMNGFTSGDTVTDFNAVPINNGSDPSAVADTGILYTKDVSSKAELFYMDEDSNAVQITSGGKALACEATYPVGSIYIATVSTDPSTLLGCGTWAAWGAGKVIVGLDSGDADFDTSEETGGGKNLAGTSASTTLTAAQSGVPAHTHELLPHVAGSNVAVGNYLQGSSSDADYGTLSTAANSAAPASSGHTHSLTSVSNVQPYIVAYMWERTS